MLKMYAFFPCGQTVNCDHVRVTCLPRAWQKRGWWAAFGKWAYPHTHGRRSRFSFFGRFLTGKPTYFLGRLSRFYRLFPCPAARYAYFCLLAYFFCLLALLALLFCCLVVCCVVVLVCWFACPHTCRLVRLVSGFVSANHGCCFLLFLVVSCCFLLFVVCFLFVSGVVLVFSAGLVSDPTQAF